ncbi:hypothetical protein Taro_013961 [Colocasia esculenta]|uniref:Uncharacterized protein n=1 Tax=Colocasia esculenta TaxID=4460 RepID=A0A843UDK6_COLES|nr:hypothetical protein [Colocasia esculenta]
MSTDWGPVIVAVVLFIVLSPGLLFQLPARTRMVEFGNMNTSGISILVHSIFFFCILTILVVAIEYYYQLLEYNSMLSKAAKAMRRGEAPVRHLASARSTEAIASDTPGDSSTYAAC